MMRTRLACCLALLVAAGRGTRPTRPRGTGTLRVVATTTQLQDLVRNVGGRRVSVTGILKPNVDPHEYEPRPVRRRRAERAPGWSSSRASASTPGWAS